MKKKIKINGSTTKSQISLLKNDNNQYFTYML